MFRQLYSYINTVSIVNVILWVIGITLAFYMKSAWYLLIPLLGVIINDIVAYTTGKNILFDKYGRTQWAYQWFDAFVPKQHSLGLDLGFNLYENDINKNPNQAQIDKFRHACQVLGITKGTRVLDLGCGWGDWLSYLKNEVGCKVEGLNLTKPQVLVVESRGIRCHHANVFDLLTNKALQEKLFGRFDVITAWDTIEHWAKCGNVAISKENGEKQQAATYQNAFWIMEHLLDPKGLRRVWISCVHQVRPVKGINEWMRAFLMNSMYSGHYPFQETGLTQYAKNFKVDLSEDRTNDYVLTSLLNPEHFGWFHTEWTAYRVFLVFALLILDPYSLHKWAYHFSDTWLWQFGYAPNAENPLARVYFKALTLNAPGI